MKKIDIAAALLTALLITAVLVVPSLITLWLFIALGQVVSFNVITTVVILIFLMTLSFTLKLTEDE